jgi:hypothetical protein
MSHVLPGVDVKKKSVATIYLAMAMGMQGSASLTFARMAMALAGAGVSVWGAQRICDEKISALKSGGGKANPNYAKCVQNVPAGYPGGGAAWKVAGPGLCASKYPPTAGKGSMFNKVLFYGGFAIIVGSVLIMWLLNSQMFSGMGMGMGMMGGGYGGGYGAF